MQPTGWRVLPLGDAGFVPLAVLPLGCLHSLSYLALGLPKQPDGLQGRGYYRFAETAMPKLNAPLNNSLCVEC